MKKNFALALISVLILVGAGCTTVSNKQADSEPVQEIPMDESENNATSTEMEDGVIVEGETMMDVTSTENMEGEMINEDSTSTETSDAITIAVIAKQWEFVPSTITVKKGQIVTLTITSTDVTHGFALPDFNINSTFEAGKTTTVTFTADKTGSFSFFCSVICGEGHRDMKGTLVVTE